MDDLCQSCKLPTEGASVHKHAVSLCKSQTGLTEPQPTSFIKEERNWNNVSLVWRCWLLGSGGGVMWCCAVVFRGGSRVTYCIFINICCSSSPTLHSVHFIPNSHIHFLYGGDRGGGATLHLRFESRFYQAETLIAGMAGWLVVLSILWVPFQWNSLLEDALEHISDGEVAPLSRKLPNLHYMEGVTQALDFHSVEINSIRTSKQGSFARKLEEE